jgi:hypothetical protein
VQTRLASGIACSVISLYWSNNSVLKMLLPVTPSVDNFQVKTAHRVFSIDLVLSIKLTGSIQLFFPFTEFIPCVYRVLERSLNIMTTVEFPWNVNGIHQMLGCPAVFGTGFIWLGRGSMASCSEHSHEPAVLITEQLLASQERFWN